MDTAGCRNSLEPADKIVVEPRAKKARIQPLCRCHDNHCVHPPGDLVEEGLGIHMPERGEKGETESVGDRLHALGRVYGPDSTRDHSFDIQRCQPFLKILKFLFLVSLGFNLNVFHAGDPGNDGDGIEVGGVEHVGILGFRAGGHHVPDCLSTINRFLAGEDGVLASGGKCRPGHDYAPLPGGDSSRPKCCRYLNSMPFQSGRWVWHPTCSTTNDAVTVPILQQVSGGKPRTYAERNPAR